MKRVFACPVDSKRGKRKKKKGGGGKKGNEKKKALHPSWLRRRKSRYPSFASPYLPSL
jgi:hypothetical protein